MLFRRGLTAALLVTPIVSVLMSDANAATPATDPDNTVYMDLKDGRVVIELLPQIAPKAVAHEKALIKAHFYDGTPFHRVIEGFMAQGGDPTGTGTGGSNLGTVPGEFTTERKFLRGTVGAARTSDPDSADSQFFIMFAPAPNLDGQYTIWGQVVSGMQYVDNIRRGTGGNGEVSNPDKIVKMRLASDPN